MIEFVSLGIGRAGHTGQLGIHTEVVLESNRRQRLVFFLNLHAFFGFHRLVQTVRPTAAWHHAAIDLIDDGHFAIAHHVMLIAVVKIAGAQGSVQVVHQGDVGRFIEARSLRQHAGLGQQGFRVLMALFG